MIAGRLAVTAALFLATTGCAAPPPAGAAEVKIRYSRFLPSEMTFEAGTTVRFVIRNADPIDHEFILGDEGVQRRHESGTHARHGEVPGEVSVPALSEATTTYTFKTKGSLTFACHLPGHFAYGMRGRIRVAS